MRKIEYFLEYLLAFLFILQTNTIYQQYASQALRFATFVTLFILVLINYQVSTKKGNIILPVIFVLFFSALEFLNVPNAKETRQFFALFFCILPLIFAYHKLKQGNLSLYGKYANIMAFVSFYTSILWMLCSFLEVLPLQHVIYNYWADGYFTNSFYYIYIETQHHTFMGVELVRNSAFFAEAPMFAFSLLTALIINVFFIKKKTIVQDICLLFGIITSTSYTAYILLIGIVFLQKKYSFDGKFFRFCMSVAILIGGYMAFQMLLEDKQENNMTSYSTRSGKYISDWNIFLDNILLGKGFYSNVENNSNSITHVFSEMGLLGGAPVVLALFVKPIRLYLNKIKSLAFGALLFFIAYCVTIVTYTPIAFSMIAFMITLNLHDINYEEGN